MQPFLAYRVHSRNGEIGGRLERITLDDLPPGDVLIKARYSGINYKDALAATGKGKIMRRFPMVGGIDVAGTVERSENPRFSRGASVVITGCGLSEDHDGGFAQFVRVPADLAVALPPGLSLRECMALGTAGFTAALAVEQMERNGQTPEQGPVLVNGASGGVGSFAIDMLAGLGYTVTAYSGKRAAEAYLRELGAADILWRDEVQFGGRPMEKALFAGAVDNLGGDALAWLTRIIHPNGNIAAIGLAAGFKLETTVMPFILRGINLLGINSVLLSAERRMRAWQRLSTDLKPHHLDAIVTREVSLKDIHDCFPAYISGEITGRTVVRIDQ